MMQKITIIFCYYLVIKLLTLTIFIKIVIVNNQKTYLQVSKMLNFFSSVSKDPSTRASVLPSPRASVSSAPGASESSAPVKKFELINCYIQKKDGTFAVCPLNRDNDGKFHDFCDFKQIIFRQYGKPDLFLLFKRMPTFDQINEIAVNNGFKTPIGLQTIEEIDGGIKTNAFLFKFNSNFGEKSKYYVIFEDDGAVVTLKLGLSCNQYVFIDQHLTKVEQTLFLQMGRIKYILQFGKKLNWGQLKEVLKFKEIIGNNQVSRVVGQEYYNGKVDENLKKSYICTEGSIWFDCAFIELTEILSHGSLVLGINNSIREECFVNHDKCPLGYDVNKNAVSAKNSGNLRIFDEDQKVPRESVCLDDDQLLARNLLGIVFLFGDYRTLVPPNSRKYIDPLGISDSLENGSNNTPTNDFSVCIRKAFPAENLGNFRFLDAPMPLYISFNLVLVFLIIAKLKKDASSTTIQACFRGYRSRKQLKYRKSLEIEKYNTAANDFSDCFQKNKDLIAFPEKNLALYSNFILVHVFLVINYLIDNPFLLMIMIFNCYDIDIFKDVLMLLFIFLRISCRK